MDERFPRIRIALMIAAALLLAGAAPADADVSAENSWVAEPPPGAEVAAGYLIFTNDGDEAVDVVGASSPLCERVELHTTDMSDGIARMRKQESLTIPAHGVLALEAGGTHLMLIRPEPLSKGGMVPITFELSTGEHLSIEAMVKKQGDHEAGEHRHH
jgi:copper(I)-binding protein